MHQKPFPPLLVTDGSNKTKQKKKDLIKNAGERLDQSLKKNPNESARESEHSQAIEEEEGKEIGREREGVRWESQRVREREKFQRERERDRMTKERAHFW